MTDSDKLDTDRSQFLEERLDRIERLAKSELRKKNCTDPDGHFGEVANDVSMKVLKKWAQLRSPDDALNTIVIRTARTHAYNCRRERPLVINDDAIPIWAGGAVDPVAMAEQAILIGQLLSSLDEIDQQIISNRFQGLDYDQIATILGMSSSAVRARWSRAVGKLRRMYRPERESLDPLLSPVE